MTRELATTVLDILALLLLAAGVIAGLWPVIEGWSIACGGGVVLVGSQVIDRLGTGKPGSSP